MAVYRDDIITRIVAHFEALKIANAPTYDDIAIYDHKIEHIGKDRIALTVNPTTIFLDRATGSRGKLVFGIEIASISFYGHSRSGRTKDDALQDIELASRLLIDFYAAHSIDDDWQTIVQNESFGIIPTKMSDRTCLFELVPLEVKTRELI